ncbi:MAG: phage protein Gp37 [Syntrophobacteraceae bacterium]
MYTAGQIEDAITERLKSQMPGLRECASLARFLTAKGADRDGERLLSPAVYVVYSRGKYSHAWNGVQDREMFFNVVAMVENLRGDVAARHGEGSETGAYELIEAVRATLSGEQCGLDIDPLAPVSEEAIRGDATMAMYGITFRTSCRFAI